MNKDALIKWKQRIFNYQEKVRNTKPPQQQTLFELPKTSWHTVDDINPFDLKIHSSLFWRMPEPRLFAFCLLHFDFRVAALGALAYI